MNAYSNIVAPNCFIISPVAFAEPPNNQTIREGGHARCDQVIHDNDSVRRIHRSLLHLENIFSVFFYVFRLDRLPR